MRNAYAVETDAAGTFTMRYAPKAGQSGHIGFGACYPSEQLKTEMAATNYYAMSVGKKRVFCNLLAGIPYKGSIAVTNQGNLPLSDVKVEVLHTDFECARTFTPIATLAGKTTGEIAFELTRATASTENVWDTIPVRITTAEGLEARVCLYCFTQDARGQMLLSTSSISTTIYTGETTDYTFYIYNSGLGETGEINILLPKWMQALTATTLPSLAPQDTATISLRFVPDESMQLNVPLKGEIAINAKNANGVQLPYSIEPVSNKNGTLHIEVCDEYTYYSEGAPKVKNAQVVVKHPYTGAVVTRGLTNEQGIYEVALPAGYYSLAVTADYHSSVNGTILLEADRTLEKQFNLSVQSIQVSFTVEETEVEDSYEIVTSVKYETNVPVPQVIPDIPSMTEAGAMAEGESMIFYVTATNKGLITAEDVTLTWPTDNEDMLFEPLEYSEPFDLAAGQSVTVPLRLTRKAGTPAHSPEGPQRGPIKDSWGCYEIVNNIYYWDCGPDREYHEYAYPINYVACENRVTEAIRDVLKKLDEVLPKVDAPEFPVIPAPNPVPNDTVTSKEYPEPIIKPYQPDDAPIKDVACEPCRNYYLMCMLDMVGVLKLSIPGMDVLEALYACDETYDAIKEPNSIRWRNYYSAFDLELLETAMHDLYKDGQDAQSMGYASLEDMLGKELELFRQRMDSAGTSVCASIQLSFSQKVAMTRQAFRGTLNVYNGHESVDMSDVHLTLNVYNKATGERVTPHEMEMQAESLTGFIGKASMDENETWVLPANTTGEATFLFIPTKYAAPTDTTVYTFAGTLSYFDPYSQTHVDRVLYPVDVKVAPTDGEYVLTLSPTGAASWTGYQVSLLRNRQTVQLLLPQSSAYLPLSAGTTTEYSIRIAPTISTATDDVPAMQSGGVWYDISGRPAEPTQSGVYIRSGEKMVKW